MKQKLTIAIIMALFTPFLTYAYGIDADLPDSTHIRFTINGIAVAPNYGYSGCNTPVCNQATFNGNLPGTSGATTRTLNGDGDYVFAVANTSACSVNEVYYGYNGTGSCNVASTTVTILGGEIYQVRYNQVLVIDNSTSTTRIITTDPYNEEVTATTTNVGAFVYINEEDWVEGMYLHVNLVNNTLAATGGSALDAWNAAFGGTNFELNAGNNTVGTSTNFIMAGQVNATWQIKIPNTTPLIGSFLPDQTIVSSSTVFVVGYRTGLDIAMASTSDILISALITGTTTQSIIRCNPWNFDITVCVVSLIYPPQSVMSENFDRFRNLFLEKWPIGYVTRMIDIMNASTTLMIPVINATIPNGVVGAGSRIYLDPNHAIDYILNSSASDSGFGTSTDTLYETTSYYWNIIVYALLGLYILRRILGSHLIPHGHKKA